MKKITLDAELLAKLNGLKHSLEVCDAEGRTVGYFLPAAEYRKLLYDAVESARPPVSEEELDRRRNEGGGISLKEFWKKMGVS